MPPSHNSVRHLHNLDIVDNLTRRFHFHGRTAVLALLWIFVFSLCLHGTRITGRFRLYSVVWYEGLPHVNAMCVGTAIMNLRVVHSLPSLPAHGHQGLAEMRFRFRPIPIEVAL
jgi:hypothetical protein